jgi:hypothetical protein
MMASHEHFEFLCGLAASEELAETEMTALRQHAQSCLACRARIMEMTQLTSHLLLAHAFQQKQAGLSQGMRERFVTKAISEGVPLVREETAGIGKLGLAGVLLAMLLVAAVVLNHAAPPPSAAVLSQLQAAPMPAKFPGDKREEPKAIALSRRHTATPSRRSLPIYRGTFSRPDFPAPLNLLIDTPARSRFPAPLVLRRNNALNLMANFQPEISSPPSRTFEYSGSSVPRLFSVCRCESR